MSNTALADRAACAAGREAGGGGGGGEGWATGRRIFRRPGQRGDIVGPRWMETSGRVYPGCRGRRTWGALRSTRRGCMPRQRGEAAVRGAGQVDAGVGVLRDDGVVVWLSAFGAVAARGPASSTRSGCWAPCVSAAEGDGVSMWRGVGRAGPSPGAGAVPFRPSGPPGGGSTAGDGMALWRSCRKARWGSAWWRAARGRAGRGMGRGDGPPTRVRAPAG